MPWQFYDTDWIGGFEVTSIPSTESLKAFISYSWDTETHKDWVRRLVEELRKHNIDAVFDQKDLRPGERLPCLWSAASQRARSQY